MEFDLKMDFIPIVKQSNADSDPTVIIRLAVKLMDRHRNLYYIHKDKANYWYRFQKNDHVLTIKSMSGE